MFPKGWINFDTPIRNRNQYYTKHMRGKNKTIDYLLQDVKEPEDYFHSAIYETPLMKGVALYLGNTDVAKVNLREILDTDKGLLLEILIELGDEFFCRSFEVSRPVMKGTLKAYTENKILFVEVAYNNKIFKPVPIN